MYPKLIAVVACAAMPVAHGNETLRCGRWLVDVSATVDELIKKCGEPDAVHEEETDVRAQGRHGMIKVGTTITAYLTYDRGTQAPPMIVTIKGGKIYSIKRDES